MQGIRLVDVTGAIVTIAAMGTQTALATEVVVGGADDVLALKGNQEKRHDAVVAYVVEQMQTDFSDSGARRLVTPERSHGRVEQRIVIPQCPPLPPCPGSVEGRG